MRNFQIVSIVIVCLFSVKQDMRFFFDHNRMIEQTPQRYKQFAAPAASFVSGNRWICFIIFALGKVLHSFDCKRFPQNMSLCAEKCDEEPYIRAEKCNFATFIRAKKMLWWGEQTALCGRVLVVIRWTISCSILNTFWKVSKPLPLFAGRVFWDFPVKVRWKILAWNLHIRWEVVPLQTERSNPFTLIC